MKENKFSMNIVLVIAIFVSAVTFFITVKMTQTAASLWGVNIFCPIENSEYAVKYSNIETNGIYKGGENVNSLVLEGDYGYDGSAVIEGDTLYVNEYDLTNLGIRLCKVVKINLKTLEKSTLFDDAELRGKCASGEIVICEGVASKTNNPETNLLCKLYAISGGIEFNKKSTVFFYDTVKEKIVFTSQDNTVNEKAFKSLFLDRTLSEVKK